MLFCCRERNQVGNANWILFIYFFLLHYQEGGADPNRVGGPTNHLLSDNLSTEIGASDKGMNALTQNLKRTLAQGSNPDRSLTTGFKRIAKLCDNLGLVRGIYDRACELFKKVTEGQMVKGRSASSIIPAVVFLACRHEQMPRESLLA